MMVEMTCTCAAYINVNDDTEQNNDTILSWGNRFANAHANCGFVTTGMPTALEDLAPTATSQPDV
jgi:hypothetical protein